MALLLSSVCTPGVWVEVLNAGQPVSKEDVWSGFSLCSFRCASLWQLLASKACRIAERVLTASWLSALSVHI
jgi:hypothetical protein